jgi:hypothetical protein
MSLPRLDFLWPHGSQWIFGGGFELGSPEMWVEYLGIKSLWLTPA